MKKLRASIAEVNFLIVLHHPMVKEEEDSKLCHVTLLRRMRRRRFLAVFSTMFVQDYRISNFRIPILTGRYHKMIAVFCFCLSSERNNKSTREKNTSKKKGELNEQMNTRMINIINAQGR